jgi:1,4-alpha-glucan branching enzyme
MWGHPGKKLMFMGCEIAQWKEWDHDGVIDWALLEFDTHRGIQNLVVDLNTVYRDCSALYLRDWDSGGFRWIVGDDAHNSVFAFLRLGEDMHDMILVVCNMTPEPRKNYRIGVPTGGCWIEVLNTDATKYGGSNMGNFGGVTAQPVQMHGEAQSLDLTLPPLATLFLVPETSLYNRGRLSAATEGLGRVVFQPAWTSTAAA